MHEWRRSHWNPAALYTLLGLGLLAFSVALPWLSAARTARVEQRAARLADLLADAAAEHEGALDATAADWIHARLLRLAAVVEAHTSDLERVEPVPEGVVLWLRNKHYALQLAISPTAPNQPRGTASRPAFEVLAWPLRTTGPGHCAFFVPEDAPRAYTRNLGGNYAGFGDDRPEPGSAHRREGAPARGRGYRSQGGERWLFY